MSQSATKRRKVTVDLSQSETNRSTSPITEIPSLVPISTNALNQPPTPQPLASTMTVDESEDERVVHEEKSENSSRPLKKSFTSSPTTTTIADNSDDDLVMIDADERSQPRPSLISAPPDLPRPQRKAAAEANSRVQAMAVSLFDESEVGGKRRRSNHGRSEKPHQSSTSSQQARASTKPKKRRMVEIVDDSTDEQKDRDVQIIDDETEEAPMDMEDEDENDDADDDEDEKAERRNNQSTFRKRSALKSATRTSTSSTTTTSSNKTQTTTSSTPAVAAAVAAAASFSSSDAPEAAPKRKRDLRRDKRISGFGSWKVVHKSMVPAMTYEGYEDLATETLEIETQKAVRASLPYAPQGTDSYHHDPTDILTGKAEMPLTLMRRVDTKYGREEYKVKASRNIDKKEVVAFLGGRLMEMVKANKQNREEWNQHFHMKKEWLKEFFEYPGQHDLVVSTKDHKCIASYIRSPEDRDDEGEGANLKSDVVFDTKSGLFMIIYYATERIKRGQEVFCMPFLGDWHDRCHREMFLYSRVSHWFHKWAAILEKNLLAIGAKFDATVPTNMKSQILTVDQEEKFLNIPGMDQGALPEPLPIDKSMVVVEVDEAMKYCNCEYSPKAKQIDLSTETQHYIDAVGDFIPDYLDIQGELEGQYDDDMNPIVGVIRIRVNKEEVLQLIENGVRPNCLELREELGIHSPVRHFTPPNYRAFCVVATAPIPRGTFVFAYAGEITEEIVNRDSAYVYVMEQEQIRRTVKSYWGPDLALDALKLGNISRFVNDNTYRLGEAEQKGSTANLETQFLFIQGTIHLGFYTTRDIQPKEELVSQYGEDYWKTINKQLIGEHKKFYDYINPYTRKLEQLTYKLQKKLPQPPPDDWQHEDEEIFRPKPLPYPSLSGEPSDDEDGGHEVERILQVREDWEGRKEYYVKWKHSSSAENSWIKAKQIINCVDLIAEFEEAEANKRAGHGANKSKSTAKKSAIKKK